MSVCILTGASTGIGNAIAKIYLSKEGTKLIAVARSQGPLEELVKEFGEERVGIVVGDIAKTETTEKCIDLAISKFGKIDSVIANAGVLEPVTSVEDLDINAWKKAFDINFFSVVELAKLSLPHLRQSKGRFVSVSSGASIGATKGWGCYGSSKAALNHLMLTLADDEPEIQTISVAPGVVDTSMQDNIRGKYKDQMKAAHKRFIDLKNDNKLLTPDVPATIYVNLVLKGWDSAINGKYLRYSDEALKDYAH
ncbi:uncharacterized oxidoreductase [[Candida] jaroonii]|uniref:Uncharacterized oxidoreductase n=1 Tax=[Candida] jaroonii TaxID=467808 RepID=A0ACA9Y9P6_9ASCO|nr:uncharacterized oxidoreductase [[Candida] jaroonii]